MSRENALGIEGLEGSGVLEAGSVIADLGEYPGTEDWAEAGFGHTKIQGKTLLVRGLNALAAVISTPLATPGGSSPGPCARAPYRPRSPPVTTDRAPADPRVLEELIPSALHTVERYANNPVEADHGRLKARLRPMRGLKRHRSARVLAAGHAFMQNLRAASMNSLPMSPPATGSMWPSTSSCWPSDQPVIPVSALCHAHRSANATLPVDEIFGPHRSSGHPGFGRYRW